MTLSLDTLNLLAVILSQQTVSASLSNYDEVSAAIGKARRELLAAIEEATIEEATAAEPVATNGHAPNRATRRAKATT